MARVAEPAYDVVRSDGDIEIRRYQPMIVATVVVSGTRREAANAGFRKLADFIFGANRPAQKIDMTAPVLQAPAAGGTGGGGRAGEKIDMTAPVLQEPTSADRWTVGFVMPARYTLDSLPKPTSGEIEISRRPAETLAVIRFSGVPNQSVLDRKTTELRRWLASEGMTPKGEPRFAFYDPPWTLPFMRRNEVMFEIDGA